MSDEDVRKEFLKKTEKLDAIAEMWRKRAEAGQLSRTDFKEAMKVASMAISDCVSEMENRDESSRLSARTLSVITETLRATHIHR
ncbi:MAG: hypothetical protein ABSC63_07430 [Candidatus Binataceae bacterium]|jgi:hypothetical protein